MACCRARAAGRYRRAHGVHAGLWLGLGILAGELVAGQHVIHDWVPGRILAAVALAWVVPLFAWTVRPGQLRWVREAVSDLPEPPSQPLPALRRVVLPGVLGGAVGALGLLVGHDLPELEFIAGTFVAVTAAGVPAHGVAADVLGHRAIGVVYHPERERLGNYVPTILDQRYDLFVHCDHTTALNPLHQFEHAQGEMETYPYAE